MRTPCALTLIKSRFFLASDCMHCIFSVFFLCNYLYVGTTIMPLRALASGLKHCGGNKVQIVLRGGDFEG